MKTAFISAMLLMLCACAPSGGATIRPIDSLSAAVTAAPVAAPESASPVPSDSSAITVPLPSREVRQSEAPPAPVQDGAYIRVEKTDRRLYLWQDGELILDCPAGLGFAPEGDKEREGDGRTPEGLFYVCSRNDRSSFYLSLGLSYPNDEDARRGLSDDLITREQALEINSAIAEGRRPPWNTPLGGEIMIHGMGGGSDWTAGCVAVDNEHMDILWEYGARGTPVEIVK